MLLRELPRQAWQKHNNNSGTDSTPCIPPARADVMKDALTYRYCQVSKKCSLCSPGDVRNQLRQRVCQACIEITRRPSVSEHNVASVRYFHSSTRYRGKCSFPVFFHRLQIRSGRLFVISLEYHLRSLRRIILAYTAFQIR